MKVEILLIGILLQRKINHNHFLILKHEFDTTKLLIITKHKYIHNINDILW